jgi:hypothetical protein
VAVASTVLLAVAAVAAIGALRSMASLRPPPREVPRVVAPTPVSHNDVPAPLPPPPAKGTLILHVNRDQARVEIDGALVAAAAGTVRVSVDGGVAHLVRASAPGYHAFEKRITVAADATVETSISLARVESRRAAPAPLHAPVAAPAPQVPADPNDVIDAYPSQR